MRAHANYYQLYYILKFIMTCAVYDKEKVILWSDRSFFTQYLIAFT